jgi:GDP-L-fucose synthase
MWPPPALESGPQVKDLDFFSGKRCLVTGGTGLIGREVVHLLLSAGAHVKSVSLDRLTLHPSVEHIFGDLTDFSFCLEHTRGMDCVFHLAGIKGSIEVTKSQPASFFVPLLMFNTNVLEAARRNGVKKLVYTSSIGAYASAEVFIETENREGPPMDMYPGWAKRMAELQVQAYQAQYGLDWAVVRPCNVYGPGDNFDPANAMVIPTLMTRIIRGEKPVVVWGDGAAIRDFAFSGDVALGTLQALVHGTRGDFVNLGSGVGYTVRQLLETLQEFIDFDFVFDPSKPSGFPRRVMDIGRAREWIGYSPSVSLREGLERTWNWYRNHQDEYLKKQNYFK